MPSAAEIADAIIARWGAIPVSRDASAEYLAGREQELDLQPFDIRLFDLSAANANEDIPFDGNVVAIYHLEGAPGAQTPFLNVHYNTIAEKAIPIFGEITIKKRFKRVHFSWPALVGGYAAVLLGVDFQV
jgi:hypothetical protein